MEKDKEPKAENIDQDYIFAIGTRNFVRSRTDPLDVDSE